MTKIADEEVWKVLDEFSKQKVGMAIEIIKLRGERDAMSRKRQDEVAGVCDQLGYAINEKLDMTRQVRQLEEELGDVRQILERVWDVKLPMDGVIGMTAGIATELELSRAEVERLRKELEGKRQLHQLTNDELADATTENVRLTAQVDWLKSRLDKAVLMMVTPEFAKVRAEIKRLHEGQRWIPVDEKLPDEDIKVLVAVDENIQICFRSCGWWWTVADVDAHSVNATHWMPLPKPPVMEKGHE